MVSILGAVSLVTGGVVLEHYVGVWDRTAALWAGFQAWRKARKAG